MNTSALWIMVLSLISVSSVTIYYFYKAFVTPSKPADDGKPEITKPDFT